MPRAYDLAEGEIIKKSGGLVVVTDITSWYSYHICIKIIQEMILLNLHSFLAGLHIIIIIIIIIIKKGWR